MSDGLPFRLVLMVLLATFSCPWARPQTPVPTGPRIIHESWTFKEGAPEAAEALAQTTDGYLWVGTQSGLFRFDGVGFAPFPLTSWRSTPVEQCFCLICSCNWRPLGRLSFWRLQFFKEWESYKLSRGCCNSLRFCSRPARYRVGCYLNQNWWPVAI